MPEVIRRDPLVPFVGIVSVVVYVLHGFHGALTRDLAIYSYAGQQVADGDDRAGGEDDDLGAVGEVLLVP